MSLERALRLIAGIVIVTSVLLGHFVSPYWYGFTAFVGANLIMSAFINWCPMMSVLRRLGINSCDLPPVRRSS